VDQLLAHPQLLAREMVQRLPHPTLGEVVVPGVVVKLSATPGAVHRLGPGIGEHNAEVYGSLLGIGAEEIARLRAAQII
jgi:crotonobetainyl-CoA:carnitine CoA-transferase CaiB-like acyl-CoA transferase